MHRIYILDIPIDSMEFSEFQKTIRTFLEKGESRFIVTPNPEFLVAAHRHASFKKILQSADLAIPDGVGLLLAATYTRTPIARRITGVQAMTSIIITAAEQKKRVFLLGGREGVAKRAAHLLQKKIPGLTIHGESGGVVEKKDGAWYDEDTSAIDIMRRFNPDIVFVGLGHEKQEQWIHDHRAQFPHVTLWMGVGGTFDYIAGIIRRAPRIARLLGFEWLWRLFRQPWRIKRIFDATIYFSYLVIRKKHQQKV